MKLLCNIWILTNMLAMHMSNGLAVDGHGNEAKGQERMPKECESLKKIIAITLVNEM